MWTRIPRLCEISLCWLRNRCPAVLSTVESGVCPQPSKLPGRRPWRLPVNRQVCCFSSFNPQCQGSNRTRIERYVRSGARRPEYRSYTMALSILRMPLLTRGLFHHPTLEQGLVAAIAKSGVQRKVDSLAFGRGIGVSRSPIGCDFPHPLPQLAPD